MTWQFPQSSDEDGLRLIVAFLQISDPLVRTALIEAAEHAASRSAPSVVNRNMLRQDNAEFGIGAFASSYNTRAENWTDDDRPD